MYTTSIKLVCNNLLYDILSDKISPMKCYSKDGYCFPKKVCSTYIKGASNVGWLMSNKYAYALYECYMQVYDIQSEKPCNRIVFTQGVVGVEGMLPFTNDHTECYFLACLSSDKDSAINLYSYHQFAQEHISLSELYSYAINKNLQLFKLFRNGNYDTIATADKDHNIYAIRLLYGTKREAMHLYSLYQCAQAKITSLQWIVSNGDILIASSGYDGMLRIWSQESPFCPIYEYDNSKRWIYNSCWNQEDQVIMLCTENKIKSFISIMFKKGKIASKRYAIFHDVVLSTASNHGFHSIILGTIDGCVFALNKKYMKKMVWDKESKRKDRFTKLMEMKLVDGISTLYFEEKGVPWQFEDGMMTSIISMEMDMHWNCIIYYKSGVVIFARFIEGS